MKLKVPKIPLPAPASRKKVDMDGYVVFDSDLRREEKKRANKRKIQKAKE